MSNLNGLGKGITFMKKNNYLRENKYLFSRK